MHFKLSCSIAEANLIMINEFKERYNVISGLSDHSIGITAPVVATCMGAQIIEKHFILDRSIGGPDASFSLDMNEFSEMVFAVRNAESAIGNVNYSLTHRQKKAKSFSRSLYVVKDIKKENYSAKKIFDQFDLVLGFILNFINQSLELRQNMILNLETELK